MKMSVLKNQEFVAMEHVQMLMEVLSVPALKDMHQVGPQP